MKVTGAISDIHWGGPDHMPRTRQSLFANIVKAVADLAQDNDIELQMILNGDATVGGGIWRSQIWQQLMTNTKWQSMGMAYLLSELSRQLSPYVKTFRRWKLVKGNHDRNYMGECLATDLAMTASLMGLPCTFVGTETALDLAPDGAESQLCLFEHGYGHSSFYPFSYSLIRNTKDKLLQAEDMGQHITRCCFGHSHWLTVGFNISPWRVFDCLGGCQRNDRAVIGRGVRAVGGILYIHDGERLVVREVLPDSDALKADLVDGKLEMRARAEIAQVMELVFDWLVEREIIEPDILAAAKMEGES